MKPLLLIAGFLFSVTAMVTGAGLVVPAAWALDDAEIETREIQAREAFTVGDYPAALTIYAKLFAATTHPVYLRNVGRCHQMMGEPDKAINSFREFLRRAEGLTSEKREEVEGFIREMKELKLRREAEANAAAAPPPVQEPPPQPPEPIAVAVPEPALPPPTPPVQVAIQETPKVAPAAPPPVTQEFAPVRDLEPAAPVATDLMLTAPPPAPAKQADEESSNGWLWAGLVAIVIGGVVAGVMISRSGEERPAADLGWINVGDGK